MARSDIQYAGLPETFELTQGGCLFAGTVYKRANSGFDLYLNFSESELDHLDVAAITLLRRMADDRKEVFIEHLALSELDPRLILRARAELSRWLSKTLGVEKSLFDALKDLAWLVLRPRFGWGAPRR